MKGLLLLFICFLSFSCKIKKNSAAKSSSEDSYVETNKFRDLCKKNDSISVSYHPDKVFLSQNKKIDFSQDESMTEVMQKVTDQTGVKCIFFIISSIETKKLELWVLNFNKDTAVSILTAKKEGLLVNDFNNYFKIKFLDCDVPSVLNFSVKKLKKERGFLTPVDLKNGVFIKKLLKDFSNEGQRRTNKSFLVSSHCGLTDIYGCHYDIPMQQWHCHHE